MRTRLIGTAGIALTALALIGSAHANIVFNLGNANIGDTENICVPTVPQPAGGVAVGTAVPGGISKLGSTVAVDYTSNVDMLFASGNTICAERCGGGPPLPRIHNLTLALPGFAFKHVLLDPRGAVGTSVTYTAFSCRLTGVGNLCDPDPTPFTRTVLLTTGTNIMSITASAFSLCSSVVNCVPGNEVLTSVTMSSSEGLTTVQQTRLGFNTLADIPQVTIVPEPSSMLLLASGVLGLAQMLRRKLGSLVLGSESHSDSQGD